MQANQSNVSTKLQKHDFVIPEVEVASQLIDLRSSATLCWCIEVRPWPFRRWQFEGTAVSDVPSVVWHLDCILITWPTRRSRRLRIVRLKGINLVRWLSYAVDIVSGQVMPKAAWIIWRWYHLTIQVAILQTILIAFMLLYWCGIYDFLWSS